MIKAIIFDMGGVILTDKAEAVYKKFCEILKIDFEKFWNLYDKQYKVSILKGKLSIEEFCKIINKEFSAKFTNKEISFAWKEAYKQVMKLNTELLDFVKKLKKNYKVALISNAAKISLEINQNKRVHLLFDVALISCEVGLVKPEREIFELVLQKLNLNANDCVFIDDRVEHLQMPTQIGFKVIHFKNNEQLIADLKSCGVAV